MAAIGYQVGMSFTEFFELCLQKHDQNRHTHKQIHFRGPHKIDILCPLHQFGEGWELLRSMFPIGSIEHTHRTERKSWTEYFTDEQRVRAEKEFSEDLALYGESLSEGAELINKPAWRLYER